MVSRLILKDAFGRVKEVVHDVAAGLTPEQLTFRPDGTGNSIAWLIWHLTRIQDAQIADAADTDEVWASDGWHEKFALSFGVSDTGYGHTSTQVSAVQATVNLLLGYHDAVYERTVAFLKPLTDDDYSRIVDALWDPPVTLAVRLVSILSDDLQHAGQAAYIRGLL